MLAMRFRITESARPVKEKVPVGPKRDRLVLRGRKVFEELQANRLLDDVDVVL
jgi:hypothetical protein